MCICAYIYNIYALYRDSTEDSTDLKPVTATRSHGGNLKSSLSLSGITTSMYLHLCYNKYLFYISQTL